MKKITWHLILSYVALFSSVSVFSNEITRVYTIFTDNTAPCYKKSCPFWGLDIEANYGYSWLSLSPHRPNGFGFFPLNADFIKKRRPSYIPSISADLYPCYKLPFRIQINYLYTRVYFTIDPLLTDAPVAVSGNDRFIVKNLMSTFYVDWHTCTRFVPYAGIGFGKALLSTAHTTHFATNRTAFTTSIKKTTTSWGGTLGTRYFFSNYLYANLQLRYDNLGPILFDDQQPLISNPIGQRTLFLSDYLHETTAMIGLGYVF